MANEQINQAQPIGGFSLASLARAVFLLLIFTLGWMQPFPGFAGQRLTPTDAIFPVAAILWLAAVIFGKIRLRWHPAFWVIAAYLATMMMSSWYSVDPRTSFIKLIGESYLLGMSFVAFNLLENEQQLRRAVLAWLAGSAVAMAIGLLAIVIFYVQPGSWLLDYITYHYGAVPVGNYPRISSVFVSASMFCNYLNVTSVILLLARRKRWIVPGVFYLGLACVVICSVFTISIGLGGVILGFGLWFGTMDVRLPSALRRTALISGVATAVFFVVVSFVALQPYENAPFAIRVPGVNKTLYPSPRTLVWTETVQTFADNFWNGKGLNVPTSFVRFQNTEGTYSILTDAHNTFLSVAAQNGVFSLIAMFAICGYICWIGLRRWNENDLDAALCIAFMTAFVYQGLTGAFEDARHLWVLIGMVLAASQLSSSSQ